MVYDLVLVSVSASPWVAGLRAKQTQISALSGLPRPRHCLRRGNRGHFPLFLGLGLQIRGQDRGAWF